MGCDIIALINLMRTNDNGPVSTYTQLQNPNPGCSDIPGAVAIRCFSLLSRHITGCHSDRTIRCGPPILPGHRVAWRTGIFLAEPEAGNRHPAQWSAGNYLPCFPGRPGPYGMAHDDRWHKLRRRIVRIHLSRNDHRPFHRLHARR